MFKRPYVLAVVSFLVIPAVTVLAGMLINSIDPEIAVRTSNYERNFWLLTQAKNLSMLALGMTTEITACHLEPFGQTPLEIFPKLTTTPFWPSLLPSIYAQTPGPPASFSIRIHIGQIPNRGPNPIISSKFSIGQYWHRLEVCQTDLSIVLRYVLLGFTKNINK